MPSERHHESAHRRPHPPAMATSYLEFDLEREIEHLHGEPAWDKGQNAKTLVKHDDLRIVLMVLRAGATLSRHQTAGRLSIQAISGHVRVRAEGRTFDLRAGSLLVLDRMLPHDVEALEDSAMLLTISFAEREPGERA